MDFITVDSHKKRTRGGVKNTVQLKGQRLLSRFAITAVFGAALNTFYSVDRIGAAKIGSD